MAKHEAQLIDHVQIIPMVLIFSLIDSQQNQSIEYNVFHYEKPHEEYFFPH